MKPLKYLVPISLVSIMIAACNLPDLLEDDWTLSGDALFQGTPSSAVLLAAFYTCEYSFYNTSQGSVVYPAAMMVSDVADLGTSGGTFTLQFSTSQLSPSDGQYIYLIMWIDQNANQLYDIEEEWNYVIPHYGDTAFQSALECSYYYSDHYNDYMGTEPGWNQEIGIIDYEPIYSATLEGAKIANDSSWY